MGKASMLILILVLVLLILLIGKRTYGGPSAEPSQSTSRLSTSRAEREVAVCGPIKERFLFWIWSRMATGVGVPNVSGIEAIEGVSFTAGDGTVLSGYRYRALKGDGSLMRGAQRSPETSSGVSGDEADSYLLMAMGNAMLSAQIIGELRLFAMEGVDVYVYDYRGYGASGGRRRLKGMVLDFREIAEELNKRYEMGYLYGTSIGGVVVLNAIRGTFTGDPVNGPLLDYSSAVVDSAPSRLSPYGCPEEVDPVESIHRLFGKGNPEGPGNNPAEGGEGGGEGSSGDATLPPDGLLLIRGGSDRILGEPMTGPLLEVGREYGLPIFVGPELDHPFMDPPHIHRNRMEMIRDFLFRP